MSRCLQCLLVDRSTRSLAITQRPPGTADGGSTQEYWEVLAQEAINDQE